MTHRDQSLDEFATGDTPPDAESSAGASDERDSVTSANCRSDPDPDPDPNTDPAPDSPAPDARSESVHVSATDDVATYLIEDQMADLRDAVREAGQNGIDSPGSSIVSIVVTPEQSIILDDGAGVDLSSTLGRTNLSVLGAGTKQRGDDHTIGEWGIGKGAIIAKGAVRIWSHDHALHFDYRDGRDNGAFATVSGRDGVVRPTDHTLNGVLVTIDHYADEVPDPDSYEWDRYVRDLRRRFAYVTYRTNVTVLVNGEDVSRGHPFDSVGESAATETVKTDDATIAVEPDAPGEIDVYSNGLYVKSLTGLGVSGVIVSKSNLQLNFERNDIQAGCESWQRIRDTLNAALARLFDQVPDAALTPASRETMLDLMWQDEQRASEWADRDLFRLATESRVSLTDIKREPMIGWTTGGQQGADKLVERDYIVLNESDTATERLQTLDSDDNTPSLFDLPAAFDVAARAEAEGVWTGYHVIDDEATLNTDQQRWLRFARALADALGIDRTIQWGESDRDAWTDGHHKIVLTDSAVSSRHRAVWMHDLYTVLCHEWAHTSADTDQPSHGALFEQRFREYIEDPEHIAARNVLINAVLEQGFERVFGNRDVSLRSNACK